MTPNAYRRILLWMSLLSGMTAACAAEEGRAMHVDLGLEFELRVGVPVIVDTVSVTLTSVTLPETNVPGNRPIYHLLLQSDGHSEKLDIDPMNDETPWNRWRFISIAGKSTPQSI